MNSVTTDTESQGEYSLERGWRTLAIAGGVIVLIGLLAIAFPFATGISLTLLLGALLVLGGVVHGAHAITARGWTGSLWQLVLGVVSVLAGVLLLVNPVVGLVTLTLLLVAYLVVDGVTELWMSIRMADESGRGWIAASGALSLVLAALLWAGFPADATWVIGLFVGASLVATGASMAFVAYSGRKIDDVTPPAGEPRGV